MQQRLTDQVTEYLVHTAGLYHRLVLVVSTHATGNVLGKLAKRIRAPIINTSLELSRCMLDLSERQRVLRVDKVLRDLVADARNTTISNSSGIENPVHSTTTDVIFLDSIEVLFEPSLQQDPLGLLQALARNRAIVATWNGKAGNSHLTYAEPGHPEYRRYSTKNLLIATDATSVEK